MSWTSEIGSTLYRVMNKYHGILHRVAFLLCLIMEGTYCFSETSHFKIYLENILCWKGPAFLFFRYVEQNRVLWPSGTNKYSEVSVTYISYWYHIYIYCVFVFKFFVLFQLIIKNWYIWNLSLEGQFLEVWQKCGFHFLCLIENIFVFKISYFLN